MDSLGGIAVLVIIWIIGAVFDKKRKEQQKRQRSARQRAPQPQEIEPVSAPKRLDPSQLEGGVLEKVLRQIDPELADQALGKRPPPPKIEAPTEIVVVPPPVPVSETRTPRRPASDRAAETRATITRRVEAAEARVTGRTAADHAVFHDAIRRPVKKKPTRAAYPVSAMREAFVWREILGRPRAETLDEL